MAKLQNQHIFPFPIHDVFKAITDSILDQMKTKKQHNLHGTKLVGKTAQYTISNKTKALAVTFTVLEYKIDELFSYSMQVGATTTYITWKLIKNDDHHTHVYYSESSSNNSFIYKILAFFNKGKFIRTSNHYFLQIDSVLEKQVKNKTKN